MSRLRQYIGVESDDISDEELDELETILPFDDYFTYEFSGNFIITKNLVEREWAVENMCCGIVVKDIELSNGSSIYFAFDYGH